MKMFVAIILNVLLSVGGFIALITWDVNGFIAFLIFLLALLPTANYLVSKVVGVDVQKILFT